MSSNGFGRYVVAAVVDELLLLFDLLWNVGCVPGPAYEWARFGALPLREGIAGGTADDEDRAEAAAYESPLLLLLLLFTAAARLLVKLVLRATLERKGPPLGLLLLRAGAGVGVVPLGLMPQGWVG